MMWISAYGPTLSSVSAVVIVQLQNGTGLSVVKLWLAELLESEHLGGLALVREGKLCEAEFYGVEFYGVESVLVYC